MILSRHNYTPTKVRSDAEVALKEDLTEVANLIGKAYVRLSKTRYWVSEELDDISERIEEVMYDLSTNEVFDD